MECFPDPAYPQIVPNQNSLKHRWRLRMVFYGMIYGILAKFLIMGPMAGIF